MGILIVDDSSFNLGFFRNELETAGYRDISVAGSAFEAFRLLGIEQTGPPLTNVDLILMDIEMPEMSGVEACKIIKSCAAWSDTPIIFVTANKSHMAAAFEAGGMDFIEKGCERIELLARVESALSLKRETDGRKSREAKLIKELRIARQVQRSVLSPPIEHEDIRIHSVYRQSDEVSGDMLYWKQIDSHRYAVILIDVAGHGLSSAFVSMSIRSFLDDLFHRGQNPGRIYEHLNRYMNRLFEASERLMYFTAIFAEIDTRRRTIDYFNAGHPPGLLLHPQAGNTRLAGTCIPIGLSTMAAPSLCTIPYRDGTRLLLYTDGLVETPGRSIYASIDALEKEAIRLQSLENGAYVQAISDLRAKILDDVCVISILLNGSHA